MVYSTGSEVIFDHNAKSNGKWMSRSDMSENEWIHFHMNSIFHILYNLSSNNDKNFQDLTFLRKCNLKNSSS